MSTLPCDYHGSVVRGKLLGLYPALIQDGIRFSSYRRLCYDCMHQVVRDHRKDWLDSTFGEKAENAATCTACGQVQQNSAELRHFYVTAYVDSRTRRDYEAYYCQDCAGMAIQEFKLHVRTNQSA